MSGDAVAGCAGLETGVRFGFVVDQNPAGGYRHGTAVRHQRATENNLMKSATLVSCNLFKQ